MVEYLKLQQLRRLEKLSQKEMATILGVSQSFYSQLEKGIKDLNLQHKAKLCEHFDMPISFFEIASREPYIISLHEGNFYKRASINKSILESFEAICGLIQMVLRQFENHLAANPLPEIGYSNCDPIELSNELRKFYGLGMQPLDNQSLMDLIEDAGVYLVPMDFNGAKIYGFSFDNRETNSKVIVYNKHKSANLINFTLAHELGHLLLHSKTLKDSAEKEKEAHEFAANFLVPEQVFRKYARNLTAKQFMNLKSYFHVPIKSLIIRAKDLDIITAERAKYYFIELARLGWNSEEPNPQPMGKPSMFEDHFVELIDGFENNEEKINNFLGFNYNKYLASGFLNNNVIPFRSRTS
ncbi:MAG: ImmA/IrrE family metallo-endopeptidase [Vampirovibrio sp.]|nr:ImmA/IrrE family metallo-endopeptidase [Vampirovibrio sp.]